MLANTLVPVETSSKVAIGPLASGDPQVTLSHVECLPQALALDPTRPLCKENGPLAHLVWILVFNDQHDQVGLINLQVFVL